jgi:hypothetical protein
MNIEAALVRAIAAPDLADAIIGDLHESHAALAQTLGDAKALATCRRNVLRSLLSLLTYNASRALADNWAFALAAAAVTCAWCFATIPLWGHIGLKGPGFHLLRLAIIGLTLGCIPRASTLSCIFLLLLIGASDWTLDVHETASVWYVLPEHTYILVLQDGITIASMLVILHVVRFIRSFSS